MKYIKLFEDGPEHMNVDSPFMVEVSYGTDIIEEVDETLNKLKRQGLVRYFSKFEKVDSFKYRIEFMNAEGAFLFGRTRPQMKI